MSKIRVLFRSSSLIAVLSLVAVTQVGFAGSISAEMTVDDAGDAVETPIPEKALGCNSSGKHCSGLFSEMIVFIRFDQDRDAQIALQPEAISVVQASGHCMLFGGNRVWLPKDHPAADRFINQINVAQALGQRFRMDWIQGANGYCELNRIYYPMN